MPDTAHTSTEPAFADAAVIELRHLEVGDWVEDIPTQQRIRGVKVQASVTAIEPSFKWVECSQPGGRGRRIRKFNIEGVKITFGMGTGSIDLPAGFLCSARKRTA